MHKHMLEIANVLVKEYREVKEPKVVQFHTHCPLGGSIILP